jgi:hypothetical protein
MKFHLYWYAVVLLLVASACVPVMPEPSTPAPTDTSVPPTAAETTPPETVNTPDITAAPPAATVAIDGQTQTAGVGTYCWTGSGAEIGMCVDKIGIPTPLEPLVVESSFTAQFTIPVEEAPQHISLQAIPVSEADQVSGLDDQSQIFWQPKEGEAVEIESSANPQAVIELEPGLYVLNMFVSWPSFGDASYGFLVEVQQGSALLPDLQPLREIASTALQGDPASLSNFVHLTQSACTTADGLGGPPKCLAREEAGTLVEAFPIGGVEGQFVRADELSQSLAIAAESLVGVYRVPQPAVYEEYWPAGEFGLLFATGGVSPVSLIVEDGQIVRLDFHLVDDPEAFLRSLPAGDILVTPEQAATWLAE